MSYLYIAATVFFTVCGQLVLRWRVALYHDTSLTLLGKLMFISKLLLDPWVIAGLAASFIASLFWMLALTKFELSFAYPFTSLSFLLVVVAAALFFHEPITSYKIIGLACIMFGIVILSRSL